MMNHWPTVILATLEDVHFITPAWSIKSAWPMLCLPQKIRSGLKIDPLRVAISVGPNLWPGVGLTNKRIIVRHAAIIVQAQRLAAERIQLLSDLSISRIAGRDVELAVRSKSQATSGMKLRRGNAFNDDLSIDKTGRRLAIANHAHWLTVRVIRISKIKQMIRGKLRMQRDAHQPALAARFDIRNHE